MLGGQVLVKGIPSLHRARATEEITHIAVGHVPTAFEQRHVQLRLVSPKTRAPDPRPPVRLFLGQHHATSRLAQGELHHGEPVEVALFPFKLRRTQQGRQPQQQ